MLLIYLLIVGAVVLLGVSFGALHLLCAVQLVTREVISFKKAFKVTLAAFVLTCLANFVSLVTLKLNGLYSFPSDSVLTKSTEPHPILLFLILFMPGFLISWYFHSNYLTARDFSKGLSITLTYFAFLTLTTVFMFFAITLAFFR